MFLCHRDNTKGVYLVCKISRELLNESFSNLKHVDDLLSIFPENHKILVETIE